MEQYKSTEKASQYLRDKYGFGARASLAKWRCHGGGPEFRKIGGRVVYETAKLDEWAQSRMTGPLNSTAEAA